MRTTATRPVSHPEHEALARLVDYLYRDEKRNFEETGKPPDHIFRDILVLGEMLKAYDDSIK
jgi:hypothetical protein